MELSSTNLFNPKRRRSSLSESRGLRYFTFITLYFAQGLPEGMLTFGIPAWLAMNGKSPGEIASFIIVAVLPWSFKFFGCAIDGQVYLFTDGKKKALGADGPGRLGTKLYLHGLSA